MSYDPYKYFSEPHFMIMLVNCVLNFLSTLFFRYTEHSTVSLAQQWDQLRQMVMRMQHNLEQQIQAR